MQGSPSHAVPAPPAAAGTAAAGASQATSLEEGETPSWSCAKIPSWSNLAGILPSSRHFKAQTLAITPCEIATVTADDDFAETQGGD